MRFRSLTSHVTLPSLLARAAKKVQVMLFSAAAMTACWGLSVQPAMAQSFAPPDNYAVDALPRSLAAGDFNLDGRLDLAVVNSGSTAHSVSVLINTGDRTFERRDYPASQTPVSLAVGDLNLDGKPDLAVANQSGGVSVFLNTGNGAFASRVNYPTFAGPETVTIGDLNLDGKPDLAVANYQSDAVTVHFNNGNGTFAAPIGLATAREPMSVAVGDLNGDGKPDLAVANFISASVSVFLNNGNGTFAAKVDYRTDIGPRRVAIGDFNGDSRPDLVTANTDHITVSVFLNRGNGTFPDRGVDYLAGTNPISIAIADFNDDCRLDLVTASFTVGTNVSVLRNNGNGVFNTKVDFTAGPSPRAVTVGDFNNDGKLDLAVANYNHATVSVLLRLACDPLLTCDNSPPVIAAHPDVTAEATSASGAVVSYTSPTTSDAVDGVGVASCSPASGSTFSLGNTTVTCTATDTQGNSATPTSFRVSVADTTPPVTALTSVVDGSGTATADGGSTLSGSITFTFGGADAVGVAGFQCSLDGALYAPCAGPAAYSALAVGIHTFQVRAFDTAGNVSLPAIFTWTVLTPAQAIQNLVTAIGNMGLPANVENSLIAPLNNINPGNQSAACGKLDAFINQINAKSQNGQLTSAQASQLLQAASAIKAMLGC
ncbi:MAG TPA: FG-GAP-like repeat-containing protein [Pyrinomonadaceae bacterium]|nr:FG-GAP-like repeat-containing protein [Pyrinomonadaceae bacterium]